MPRLSFVLGAVLLMLAACATPRGPRSAAQPAAEPVAEKQFVVFFTGDTADLSSEAAGVVTEIAQTVTTAQPALVTVEGQDDGGTAHDAQIATDRGKAVVDALIKAGIPPNKVQQVPGAPPASATGIVAHKVVVRLVAKA